MRDAVRLYLNGEPTEVRGTAAFLTVSEFLREEMRLTATKVVCAEGDCGACSVLLGRPRGDGSLRYRAVDSCIAFVYQLDATHLVTVDALGSTAHPSPVQRAMIENFGSQCGFCTPGFVVALTALSENATTGPLREAELRRGLSGNLCRCTGYRQILDAGLSLGEPPSSHLQDLFAEEVIAADLARWARDSVAVEDGGRRVVLPRDVETAAAVLERHPEARIVSGATDLGVARNKGREEATDVVALSARIEALSGVEITRSDDGTETVAIGALTVWSEIVSALDERFPEFTRILDVFGAPQIRHLGTIGGNLMNASPIGDAIPCLIACDAQLELVSAKGARWLPIDGFYTGYKETLLERGELLARIRFEIPRSDEVFRLFKVSRRLDLDISIFTAAIRFFADDAGVISDPKVVMGGVGPVVMRLPETEALLAGETVSEELFARAGQIAQGEITPITDVRGRAEYRLQLAANVLLRTWRDVDAGWKRTPPDERECGLALEAVTAAAPPDPNSLHHDSASGHVTGSAPYVEDLPHREGELVVGFVGAPHARGTIERIDTRAARNVPGVEGVFTAADLPHHRPFGPIFHDEPFLPKREFHYLGQPLVVLAATSRHALKAAQKLVVIEAQKLEPTLRIEEAEERGEFLGPQRVIARGGLAKAFKAASHELEGSLRTGGQEQFYLESQAALAIPRENDELTIISSTQNPTEIQAVAAEVLDLGMHQVICEVKRMGGAFGGKETQAAIPALMAALVARQTGRPARVVYSKDDDMKLTGKRHEALVGYRIGFDGDGHILAADFEVRTNGGAFADLSTAVLERLMLHLDNAYYLPAVRITAQVCRTNLPPNTAFRGFGGPQGMAVIETVMEEVAQHLDLDSLEVRTANLYARDPDPGNERSNTTPYGQPVVSNLLPEIMPRLARDADYNARREEIRQFNQSNETYLRGLSLVPVKFGISFTNKTLNQANALVNVFTDGTVQVSTGATEMGQGVNTKIAQVVAEEFSIDPRRVVVLQTSTEKNNNTSPTAASASTDLNGTAAVRACATIRRRLATLAADHFASRKQGRVASPEAVVFDCGEVFDRRAPTRRLTFQELIKKAHTERVDLGARGFYATPGVDFNRETGRGTPFYYFTTGGCVAEVLIDRDFGTLQVERLDVLMDIGKPINFEIERGQVIGGLVQGIGWVTAEELVYDPGGALLSHSPTTYKIPAVSDLPPVMNIDFIDNDLNHKNLRSTKAVGEPPLMLAIAVFTAVKDALAQARGCSRNLQLPATHEEILRVLGGSEKE